MMKSHFIPLFKSLVVVLAASTAVDAISSTTLTARQLADQHVAALEKTRDQQDVDLKRLISAFQQEQRNEAWATQKESMLRTSFMAAGLAPGSLKSVECHSSKCNLQIQSSTDPAEATRQLTAIGNWLVANVPCGFTVVSAPSPVEAAGAASILLSCDQ